MYTEITTVEQACEANGTVLADILPYNPANELTGKQKWLNACAQLDEVFRAVNGGKEADWNDTDQEKWYPLFYSKGSAFVFSRSSYHYAYAFTSLGSRFATLSEEQADHIGKTFGDLYQEVLCFELKK